MADASFRAVHWRQNGPTSNGENTERRPSNDNLDILTSRSNRNKIIIKDHTMCLDLKKTKLIAKEEVSDENQLETPKRNFDQNIMIKS